MSHFNRWWSSQHNTDKAAKRFAAIVWDASREVETERCAKIAGSQDAIGKTPAQVASAIRGGR